MTHFSPGPLGHSEVDLEVPLRNRSPLAVETETRPSLSAGSGRQMLETEARWEKR